MRLVAITSVKNESDMIEAFVRHTATVCDAHLILDHQSTDNTRSILHELEREGLALRVIADSDPTSDQSARLTRLMRLAVAEEGADWVIPLDADEFIDAPTEGLRQALAVTEEPVHVLWRSYVPSADDDLDDLNPVTRIRHRLVAEGFPWKKVLVPRAVARDAQLGPGSHDIAEPHPHGERRLLGEVTLGHFPIRSPEQYATKVAIANLQWSARGNRGTLGFHYHEPFRRLAAGWTDFARTYAEDAKHYALPPGVDFTPELVHDPFPYRGGVLRHTLPLPASEPWGSILVYALALADTLGRTAENLGEKPADLEQQLLTLREQQRADRIAWEARLLEATTDLRKVSADLDRADEERTHHLARSEALLSSTSWRVTRPLRALGRGLRRLRSR